jgi:uncharacterized protein YndB with AHSA1/START domain
MEALRYEFSTSARPAALYAAAASPAGISAWWCKDCDISTKVGGRHDLRFDKDGTLVKMSFDVTELSENRRVVWKCVSNDNPVWVGSILAWEIDETDDGSRLCLVHDGFAAGGPPYEMTAAGWPRFVESLKNHVEGRPGDPM